MSSQKPGLDERDRKAKALLTEERVWNKPGRGRRGEEPPGAEEWRFCAEYPYTQNSLCQVSTCGQTWKGNLFIDGGELGHPMEWELLVLSKEVSPLDQS